MPKKIQISVLESERELRLLLTKTTIERVRGYTVKQLEDGLRGAKNWTEWRNNIKARSNNSTENFVDELFNNWQ